MNSQEDSNNGTRVTRSLRKRLTSVDSNTPTNSRPGTPIAAKLATVTEAVVDSPRRQTRRNSTNTPIAATPAKNTRNNALARAQTPELTTPNRRATRRRSISICKEDEPPQETKSALNKPLFDLPEEDDVSKALKIEVEEKENLPVVIEQAPKSSEHRQTVDFVEVAVAKSKSAVADDIKIKMTNEESELRASKSPIQSLRRPSSRPSTPKNVGSEVEPRQTVDFVEVAVAKLKSAVADDIKLKMTNEEYELRASKSPIQSHRRPSSRPSTPKNVGSEVKTSTDSKLAMGNKPLEKPVEQTMPSDKKSEMEKTPTSSKPQMDEQKDISSTVDKAQMDETPLEKSVEQKDKKSQTDKTPFKKLAEKEEINTSGNKTEMRETLLKKSVDQKDKTSSEVKPQMDETPLKKYIGEKDNTSTDVKPQMDETPLKKSTEQGNKSSSIKKSMMNKSPLTKSIERKENTVERRVTRSQSNSPELQLSVKDAKSAKTLDKDVEVISCMSSDDEADKSMKQSEIINCESDEAMEVDDIHLVVYNSDEEIDTTTEIKSNTNLITETRSVSSLTKETKTVLSQDETLSLEEKETTTMASVAVVENSENTTLTETEKTNIEDKEEDIPKSNENLEVAENVAPADNRNATIMSLENRVQKGTPVQIKEILTLDIITPNTMKRFVGNSNESNEVVLEEEKSAKQNIFQTLETETTEEQSIVNDEQISVQSPNDKNKSSIAAKLERQKSIAFKGELEEGTSKPTFPKTPARVKTNSYTTGTSKPMNKLKNVDECAVEIQEIESKKDGITLNMEEAAKTPHKSKFVGKLSSTPILKNDEQTVSSTVDTADTAEIETGEKDGLFKRSWNQNISGSAQPGLKIDAISAKEEEQIEPPVIAKTMPSPRFSSDEEEELSENEKPYKQSEYVDDEAEEVIGYQSGDSMDSEERREIEENEIVDCGESVGSDDDNDIEEEDDEYEKDSFIVSDNADSESGKEGTISENDECSSNEDEEKEEDEEIMMPKKIRKRIIEPSSDDDDHDDDYDIDVEPGESLKPTKLVISADNKSLQNISHCSVASNLSETAKKLNENDEQSDPSEDDEDKEKLNASRKEILRSMNKSDRFNKTVHDVDVSEDSPEMLKDIAAADDKTEEEDRHELNQDDDEEPISKAHGMNRSIVALQDSNTSTEGDESIEEIINKSQKKNTSLNQSKVFTIPLNELKKQPEIENQESQMSSSDESSDEDATERNVQPKRKTGKHSVSFSDLKESKLRAGKSHYNSFTIGVNVSKSQQSNLNISLMPLDDSTTSNETKSEQEPEQEQGEQPEENLDKYAEKNANDSSDEQHKVLSDQEKEQLSKLSHLKILFNPLQKSKRQSLFMPESVADAETGSDALSARRNRKSLGHLSRNDFNPSQSFIETVNEQRRLSSKRKRLSKSFSVASNSFSQDIEVHHVNKKSKTCETDEEEQFADEVPLHQIKSTPVAKVLQQQKVLTPRSHRAKILQRCQDILDAANNAKLEEKRLAKKQQNFKPKQGKRGGAKQQTSSNFVVQENEPALKTYVGIKKTLKRLDNKNIKTVKSALNEQKGKPDIGVGKVSAKNTHKGGKTDKKLLTALDQWKQLKQDVSTSSETSPNNSTDQEQKNLKKIPTSSGFFVEDMLTPKKNNRRVIEEIHMPTGTVRVELASPISCNFREEPITPVGIRVTHQPAGQDKNKRRIRDQKPKTATEAALAFKNNALSCNRLKRKR